MRITNAQNYNESRDSIAHDWYAFLINNFPDIDWILLPNIEGEILKYIKNIDLDGFILSGGEDFGVNSSRDKTEILILQYAIDNNKPILGVCRGMQLICNFFGGEILNGNDEFKNNHVAKNHDIIYKNNVYNVNSFHKNEINRITLPPNLTIIATNKIDNSIEAISDNNILGLMWHPERSNSSVELNISLIKDFFNIKD